MQLHKWVTFHFYIGIGTFLDLRYIKISGG